MADCLPVDETFVVFLIVESYFILVEVVWKFSLYELSLSCRDKMWTRSLADSSLDGAALGDPKLETVSPEMSATVPAIEYELYRY